MQYTTLLPFFLPLWQAYHDFLRVFSGVDVCKAHRGWFVNSLQGYLHRQQWHPQHVRPPSLSLFRSLSLLPQSAEVLIAILPPFLPPSLPPSLQAVHLRLPSHSSVWLHLSLIQPSTRGKAGKGGFWHSDISLLVLRLAEEGGEGGKEQRWRVLGRWPGGREEGKEGSSIKQPFKKQRSVGDENVGVLV